MHHMTIKKYKNQLNKLELELDKLELNVKNWLTKDLELIFVGDYYDIYKKDTDITINSIKSDDEVLKFIFERATIWLGILNIKFKEYFNLIKFMNDNHIL